jgi:hypothetical protein
MVQSIQTKNKGDIMSKKAKTEVVETLVKRIKSNGNKDGYSFDIITTLNGHFVRCVETGEQCPLQTNIRSMWNLARKCARYGVEELQQVDKWKEHEKAQVGTKGARDPKLSYENEKQKLETRVEKLKKQLAETNAKLKNLKPPVIEEPEKETKKQTKAKAVK